MPMQTGEHQDDIRAIEALVERQFASLAWQPGTSADWSASYGAYRVKGGARRLDRLQTMSGSASRSTVEQVHITSYPVGSRGACTHIPHARASLRGEEDRTHLYDGIKAPGTTGPYPSRFVAGDGGRLSRRTQGYALITAPSGMSPCVTYRHRAIISLRARATIIVRRMRPLLAPTRS